MAEWTDVMPAEVLEKLEILDNIKKSAAQIYDSQMRSRFDRLYVDGLKEHHRMNVLIEDAHVLFYEWLESKYGPDARFCNCDGKPSIMLPDPKPATPPPAPSATGE